MSATDRLPRPPLGPLSSQWAVKHRSGPLSSVWAVPLGAQLRRWIPYVVFYEVACIVTLGFDTPLTSIRL